MTWCILHWLDAPAPLMTCLAIEAFAIVVDSAMFFVPARVGVQEGGRVLIFTALGMSARDIFGADKPNKGTDWRAAVRVVDGDPSAPVYPY